MRKYCVVIIILMRFICPVNAQEKHISVKGKIYYDFQHNWDTTTSDQIFREVSILLFGEAGSLYRSFDRYISEQNAQKSAEKITLSGPINIKQAYGSRDLYFYDLASEKMTRVRPFFGSNGRETYYAMREDVIPVKWQIVAETKIILGYSCQKATGIVKGRYMSVWFCNDIPYSYGPWKIGGLPGLVLEATDMKGNLSFRCKKVDIISTSNESIQQIKNTLSVTEFEFETMRKAFYENPGGFSNSTSGTLSYPNGIPRKTNKVIFNNPLDLVSKAPPMPYNY